tara:strand:+ start:350 stop:541 length:192 start_codon:yes stop_codon:yes gene_type:complete
MSNVVSLCSYRKEKEVEELFQNFEQELARLGKRLHWDFVMFDQEFKTTIIWGMTHEQIISNQN